MLGMTTLSELSELGYSIGKHAIFNADIRPNMS